MEANWSVKSHTINVSRAQVDDKRPEAANGTTKRNTLTISRQAAPTHAGFRRRGGRK